MVDQSPQEVKKSDSKLPSGKETLRGCVGLIILAIGISVLVASCKDKPDGSDPIPGASASAATSPNVADAQKYLERFIEDNASKTLESVSYNKDKALLIENIKHRYDEVPCSEIDRTSLKPEGSNTFDSSFTSKAGWGICPFSMRTKDGGFCLPTVRWDAKTQGYSVPNFLAEDNELFKAQHAWMDRVRNHLKQQDFAGAREELERGLVGDPRVLYRNKTEEFEALNKKEHEESQALGNAFAEAALSSGGSDELRTREYIARIIELRRRMEEKREKILRPLPTDLQEHLNLRREALAKEIEIAESEFKVLKDAQAEAIKQKWDPLVREALNRNAFDEARKIVGSGVQEGLLVRTAEELRREIDEAEKSWKLNRIRDVLQHVEKLLVDRKEAEAQERISQAHNSGEISDELDAALRDILTFTKKVRDAIANSSYMEAAKLLEDARNLRANQHFGPTLYAALEKERDALKHELHERAKKAGVQTLKRQDGSTLVLDMSVLAGSTLITEARLSSESGSEITVDVFFKHFDTSSFRWIGDFPELIHPALDGDGAFGSRGLTILRLDLRRNANSVIVFTKR